MTQFISRKEVRSSKSNGVWSLTLDGVCTLGRDGLKPSPDMAILRARRYGGDGFDRIGPVLISVSEFPRIDVQILIELLEQAFSDGVLLGSTEGNENGSSHHVNGMVRHTPDGQGSVV